MKKILITGAGSFIGTSLEAHLNSFPGQYCVHTQDMLGDGWKDADFSGYDAVFHVAGIAHADSGKADTETVDRYYRVNTHLAVETAKKAKAEGVGQFIFMSSMSVYGVDTGVITRETIPQPVSFYGKSKLAAEELIQKEADENFKVCILRPPMVYGPGCKGNFQTVVKLVKHSPLFPQLRNERSMIHIDNLCEFLKYCIDKGENGIFFPQNRAYMQTSQMARVIAGKLGRRVFFSRLAGFAVRLTIPFLSLTKKAFGTLIYRDTELHDYCYCIRDNDDSVADSVS
jgi:UDP-glucose 4-epimerase